MENQSRFFGCPSHPTARRVLTSTDRRPPRRAPRQHRTRNLTKAPYALLCLQHLLSAFSTLWNLPDGALFSKRIFMGISGGTPRVLGVRGVSHALDAI